MKGDILKLLESGYAKVPRYSEKYNEVVFFEPVDQTILKKPIKLNWFLVSANPDITWEYIYDHPEIDWNGRGLSLNPNTTYQHVLNDLNGPQRYHWDWDALIVHPNFTWEIIRKHFSHRCLPGCFGKKKFIPWQFANYVRNPNFTLDISLQNKCIVREKWKVIKIWWDTQEIYKHENVTWKKIQTLRKDRGTMPYFGINWRGVAQNKTVPAKTLMTHPKLKEYTSEISKHKNVTLQIIEENPDFPWDWDYVWYNPNMTWEFAKANPEKMLTGKRYFYFHSMIKRTEWKNVLEFISHVKEHNKKVKANGEPDWRCLDDSRVYRHVHWEDLLESRHVTWEMIQNDPIIEEAMSKMRRLDFPETNISRNPNITFDIFINNLNFKWSSEIFARDEDIHSPFNGLMNYCG